MKRKILSVSLLSVVLILCSCQKIKDVFTVKVDAKFSVTLPVSIASSPLKSTPTAFSTSDTFDPLSSEDLADYKDKIKGYEVTGLTGRISELSADVTLTNVKLHVFTDTNSAEWTFTNLPISNGTVVTFDNTTSQWAKINEILGEGKVITVTFSGYSTQTNVTFNITVDFDTKVSTKIL